ncbi:MAG: hypothetical protein NC548_41935 [Lachnospiraceae bacterium]|nr:hypothetical protein [Lachnospiraceae bacterium]
MGVSINKVEEYSEYDGSAMETGYQNYLKNFLTKQMCKILVILFYQKLSNKALAKQMGISASALSNILQRMKISEIELFIISRENKHIFYALTPIARAYVKENLIIEEDLGLKIIQFNDDETAGYMECIDALHKLKQNFENHSEKEFSHFMELHYVKESKENKSVLEDFVKCFVKMENGKQTGNFHKVIDELGDQLLEKNILHCVGLYKSTINLCKMYNVSWRLSHKFVNLCLDSKVEGFGFDFLEECRNKRLELGEIVEMGKGLKEIADISEMNHHSMDEFTECWQAFFPEEEFFAFVASRYDSWMVRRSHLGKMD